MASSRARLAGTPPISPPTVLSATIAAAETATSTCSSVGCQPVSAASAAPATAMTRGFSPRIVQNEPSAVSSRTTDHGSGRVSASRRASARLFSSTRDLAHRLDLAGRPQVVAAAERRRRRPRPAERRGPRRPRRPPTSCIRPNSRTVSSIRYRTVRPESSTVSSDWSTSERTSSSASRPSTASAPSSEKPSWKVDSQRNARRSLSRKQVPRPVDDREQRLVPVGSRAVAAAQQGEPVVEAAVDVLDRHRTHPGSGELDGQGQPVEPAHDAQHRGRVERHTGARGAARWPNSSDAASSSSCERGKTRSAEIARGARVVVTTRRRGHDATRKATRSATASTTCSQLSRMSRAGAAPSACAARARTSLRCSGVSTRRPLTESRTPSAEPDLADDVVGRGDADQLDEVHDRLLGLPAEEVSEPGLAQAPGAEDRHDPGLADQGAQRADVVVATDEGRRLVAQPGPDRVVGGEQLGVHRGQGRSRVDAQALGEVAAHLRVAVEGGGAPVHGPQGTQQGRGRLLVADTGLLEEGECLAVVAERRQRPAQHRTRLGPQPARVVTQGGQRAVAAGCRRWPVERPPREVARGHPVAAALGCGRRRDVVAQRERVDRRGVEAEAVAASGPLHRVGRGL